ncbi:MAG: HlyC/CorC family transporter [Caldilineaceae bacterium]|nr:HlyC/CorC family transporter [Caldilineaceae bacterium]
MSPKQLSVHHSELDHIDPAFTTGALSGATLAEHVAPILAQVEWLAPYSRPLSLGLMVALVTYLSLIIGELVPKRLALNSPEQISMQVARPMYLLSVIGLPVVSLLTISTDWVLRLLGMKPLEEPPVTEEELKSLLAQGASAGVFEQEEHQLVRRALDLDDRPITSVMTPRRDMVGLNINDSMAEIQLKVIASGFSRLPVFDGDYDRVIGIVRIPELMARYVEGQDVNLRDHLYPPAFIPATASAAQALGLFRQTKIHTIMVIDEYGGVAGLITPTDILEFIVGQLPSIEDAADLYAEEIVQREDGSWLVDGLFPLHDLATTLLGGEQFLAVDSRIQTINGFVMEQLSRIPTTGEVFIWSNFRFEIVDMDGNRIDKILIASVQDEEANLSVQKDEKIL